MKKTISFLMLSFMMSAHAEIRGCGNLEGKNVDLYKIVENNYVTVQLSQDAVVDGLNDRTSVIATLADQREEKINIRMKTYTDLPRRIKAKQPIKVRYIHHTDYQSGSGTIYFPEGSAIEKFEFTGKFSDIQKSKLMTIICTPKPIVDVASLLKKSLTSKACAQEV